MSSSSKPGIALIGHGSWGRNHARVLRELGALRWVYDADPQALTGVPERTSFLEKIWQDLDVHGVVIATPPATHFPLACQAIGAGKAVLVEKPMTTNVNEAVVMKELAQKAQVPLMVGHLMRYHPGFQKLLAQLDGAVGMREYVYSHRLQPGRVRSDVSSLWSLAPHDVSMLLAVAGMPRVVSCAQGVSRAGLADIITATLEFEDGVRGHMFISWLHPAKAREFMVIGEPGSITFYQDHAPVEPLRTELEHFLECVESGEQPMTGADEGIAVVRVLAACDRSLREEGAWVYL